MLKYAPKVQRRLPQVMRHFTHEATDLWIRSADSYRPGGRLRISIPGSRSMVDVKIVQAFTPFTNSVTLLIDTLGTSHHLPHQVILKLADRRFAVRNEPWSTERELEFRTKLPMHLAECPRLASENLYTDDPPWIQEFKCWSLSNKEHCVEQKAYERLPEAQCLGLIPRFFGTTRIIMSSPPFHPSIDHIDGLLLEYIPGRAMDSIKPGVDISEQEAENISQRVLELGRRLRRYGVGHGDVHLGNIIIRSRGNTPVFIDWGRAFDVSDTPLEERWFNSGIRSDYHDAIRAMFRSTLWHRFRTPLADEVKEGLSWWGWADVNQSITSLPKHELERFYYEDRNVAEDEGLRWKVKKGVRTRLLDDPVPAA